MNKIIHSYRYVFTRVRARLESAALCAYRQRRRNREKRQTKKVAFLLVFPIIRLYTGGLPCSHDHAARFSAVHVNLMQTGTSGTGNVCGYFLSGCAVRPLRVLCASCGQYADISSTETVSQGMRETGTETRL